METSNLIPKKSPKLACDRCRSRKVKCNFGQPGSTTTCSNCRAAQIECKATFPPKRRGPKPRLREYSTGTRSPSPSYSNHDQSEVVNERLLEAQEPRLGSSPQGWVDDTSSSRTAILAAQSPLSQCMLLPKLPPLYESYQDLLVTLSRVLPTYSFEAITKKCFDLFFDYLFSLIPIVNEQNLREDLRLVCAAYNQPQHESPASTTHWSTAQGGTLEPTHSLEALNRDDSSLGVKLALVTATCAEAASLIPAQLFPEGPLIAKAFLQASRKALHSYVEADMEHPNATSIATRYFHSNCLHAAGKSRVSWHIFGEAARLAQMMQLHDESSYEALDPIEAELRRRCFWILYLGDKSAATLNGLPISLHELNFVSEITVAYPTEAGDNVFDNHATDNTPKSILTGFNFNLRLWKAASDLLFEIRMLEQPRHGSNIVTSKERSYIDRLYIYFMTCLDTLPPWLQLDPGAFGNVEDSLSCPKEFSIQRVNLHVSFHCLRMMILQKLEYAKFSASEAGIEQSTTLALRKTEIARDMIRALQSAPFWGLQVNGESCVEKIRLIGASLLEVIHTNKESPLAARARGEFLILLDILTRLDSKASDALLAGSSWQG